VGPKSSNYQQSQEWALLAELVQGLAGGGSVPRSQFVVEHLHLPSIINEMAVQALVNNIDRCTKNHYLYFCPASRKWHR
jgi:hypothetical protein